MQRQTTSSKSRRDVLKTTGAAAGAALASAAIANRVYAAGSGETVRVAIVGCGGRGSGALLQAMSTEGPTKLVAMADVFADRLEACFKSVSTKLPKQVDVTPDNKFLGFDAYKKAIDLLGPGGVVLLTTPPTFRPMHVEYAVEKGCHVFMEKSFGVDAVGAKRIMKAGELAKTKNLRIAGGLMSRHYKPLEEIVQKIHDGAIGEVITAWAYREHGPVGFKPRKPGESELAHQIRNYSAFTWLNGAFILDWLIHNLDICCWVKDAWPVSCQAMGGRQQRVEPDQLFDHCAVEYTFPDGTRLLAQGRHMNSCWNFFGSQIHGSKGSAVLGEGIPSPRLYKAYNQTKENEIWKYDGPECHHYQVEHDLFFDAIRNEKPWNEAERCCKASMVGVMGRMAMESGQLVTWDQALASTRELAPNLDQMTWDSAPPVVPDADGKYPIAMPGKTPAQ